MIMINLIEKEKIKAEQWRIKKSGSVNFQDLKKVFRESLELKYGDKNKKP